MKNLFSPQLFSAGRLSFFAYCFLIYEYVKKSVCMLGMKPTYSTVSAIDELKLGKEKWLEILGFYSKGASSVFFDLSLFLAKQRLSLRAVLGYFHADLRRVKPGKRVLEACQ